MNGTTKEKDIRKYCYMCICVHERGIANLDIRRNEKVTTRTQFEELTDYLREQNNGLKNLFIINLILLDNK